MKSSPGFCPTGLRPTVLQPLAKLSIFDSLVSSSNFLYMTDEYRNSSGFRCSVFLSGMDEGWKRDAVLGVLQAGMSIQGGNCGNGADEYLTSDGAFLEGNGVLPLLMQKQRRILWFYVDPSDFDVVAAGLFGVQRSVAVNTYCNEIFRAATGTNVQVFELPSLPRAWGAQLSSRPVARG